MAGHKERDHAILSPSSAHRWLVCTPSAKLEAEFPDTTSSAAAEGTLAHEICEIKARQKFFSHSFTKSSFDAYIDGDYRDGGILEGFVFDKVEGSRLVFASSVCLPQTDEYIPLVVSVSSQGEIGIRRDSQMDTNGDEEDM